MSENFEFRLIESSSKELVKKAKGILKAGELLCCHESSGGKELRAVFRDAKGVVSRVEVYGLPDGPFKGNCGCETSLPQLCPHAIAALLYRSKYTEKVNGVEHSDGPAHYAGLKFEGLPELLTQALSPVQGYVVLEAESEFPHTPSKWERTLLSAVLKVNGRDYAGNLNNLRQLHFGKSLAATIQLNAFPQQDRQIIRYLAINAQQEGSKLSLDAEQTAELFHCLTGFQNFKRLGERVVVHRELAEPVIVLERLGSGFVLKSTIIVNGAFLPLKDVKVVTGRSGCWVGMLGEYWWIPAYMDVAWLRGFLRNTEQRVDEASTRILLSDKAKGIPVKIIETDGPDIKGRKFKPLYDARTSPDGALEMEILFDYSGRLCKADQMRLASSGGNFWKRDSQGEADVVAELSDFGFEMLKGASADDDETRLRLRDPEAIGVFVDELLPSWLSAGREFLMSSELATIAGAANTVKLECRVLKETAEYFDLSINISCRGLAIHWSELVKAAKRNESFMEVDAKGAPPPFPPFVRLPKPLRTLVGGVADIVHHQAAHGASPETLRVPRLAAAYWASLGVEAPGAVPPEFMRLKLEMDAAALPQSVLSEHSELKPPCEFKGELRKYQRDGVYWMRGMGAKGYNLILADEMGLGKTIQALAMLAGSPGETLPALILCPTSLLENWAREARKFVPSMKLLLINGPDRKPLWEKAMQSDLVISSYSLVKRDTEYLGDLKFKYLILDEAQHIKNPTTANAQTCKLIKAGHRLVLTGTPLENSPEDLWSIFDFLHPGLIGSLNAFKHRYSSIASAPELQKELAARVSPFIMRRKKADVHSELPPKQEQTICCGMDNGQRALYERFLADGRQLCEKLKGDNSGQHRFEILTTLLRLRQICCHPELLPGKLRGDEAADLAAGQNPMRSAKTDLLQEILMQSLDSGHKVLIFSQFTSLLKILRRWLDSSAIRYEYLDGATKDRMERVDAFNNNKDVQVFLLSLKAGGVGLNLTSADTVIIYDPWWNPAAEAQAADRTHRIGQTRQVTCMKLVVKNSIEEKILELQKMKSHLFESLVENPSAAMRQMTIEDLEFLLK